MYEIRYYQDWSARYIVVATCDALDKARDLRKVSGDLVVDCSTNIVVADPCWLWDWEKADARAYARQNLGKHRPGTIAGPYFELFGRDGVVAP